MTGHGNCVSRCFWAFSAIRRKRHGEPTELDAASAANLPVRRSSGEGGKDLGYGG